MQALERQIDQLSGAQTTRPQEGLPSNIKLKPKQCNVITPRNSRGTDELVPKRLGVPDRTTIMLQLATRSLARLKHIIEDVILQVREGDNKCGQRLLIMRSHVMVEVIDVFRSLTLLAINE
ncbi:hypothetical protein HAX54_015176 [Datura stramonium]|uniref:Uncharacterized protein n=1 Tax=Datura stramonium TaxID=4076 RepID=A0ABS8TQZ1_DATST|nr:hypothetical protein [Datura stramonium]